MAGKGEVEGVNYGGFRNNRGVVIIEGSVDLVIVREGVGVTVCLLYHGTFLFSFLRRTYLLFGMFSYDWVHSLILLSSSNSSFIEL